MFGITYEIWADICEMYFSVKLGSLKSNLQWFPFTKISNEDREKIKSKEFYDAYIKTGSFVLLPSVMFQSENFIQKSDGSFRDASLISPILYLVLQSIGKEIHDQYVMQRPNVISAYYAGNYGFMRAKYKQDYDAFFKELNYCSDEYQYFIKTDITNFFANISIDRLITQIDRICNSDKIVFTQTQLQLFKELLKYCGDGKLPLIENSVASSYLATVIYLDEVDSKLYKYISEKLSVFSSFHMVRYVDDLYILISSDHPINKIHAAYNEIRNEYSSILKEYGLALNTKKCCMKKTKEINDELKKSLYDEYVNGIKHNIEELYKGELLKFLKDLSAELTNDSIDVEKYNELIEKYFSSDDIEFTANEVFNYYIYENKTELQISSVKTEIINLIKKSISFIYLDPKRLTIMIMKTKSDRAIKDFLRQLFNRNRAGKWNSYDTTIAIAYLIQSKFRHIDLLEVLSKQQPDLYKYCLYNCENSFLALFENKSKCKLRKAIDKDYRAYYLYFMYLSEKKRENYLVAFAYFKSFFDRITADLAFKYKPNKQEKRPNYNNFYQKDKMEKFYSKIDGSEKIIKEAHKLRNTNPLAHSSSELLSNENSTKELKQCIDDLSLLIDKYLEMS